MNKPLTLALCGALVSALAACSGSIDDSFFQTDGTNAGVVCVDGLKVSPNGQEAKDTVTHLKKFYGGSLTATSNVSVGLGFDATCAAYTDKPKADLIITRAYYEDVIVPATP